MNAIILAAGMGSRMRPLTNEIPKCLVPVNGVPMVERQIQFLHETGITDITLVSGYKAEKLDYLKEKYGVDIVFNYKYDVCNNIFSMYLVRDRLHDTYVVEGDVYMDRNCFTKEIAHSAYFSMWKKEEVNEWGLTVDADNRLQEIVIGSVKGYIMSGISFWTKSDAAKIVKHLEELIADNHYTDLYWDNTVLDIYRELAVYVKEVDCIYEIDTVNELRQLEKKLLVE